MIEIPSNYFENMLLISMEKKKLEEESEQMQEEKEQIFVEIYK